MAKILYGYEVTFADGRPPIQGFALANSFDDISARLHDKYPDLASAAYKVAPPEGLTFPLFS